MGLISYTSGYSNLKLRIFTSYQGKNTSMEGHNSGPIKLGWRLNQAKKGVTVLIGVTDFDQQKEIVLS